MLCKGAFRVISLIQNYVIRLSCQNRTKKQTSRPLNQIILAVGTISWRVCHSKLQCLSSLAWIVQKDVSSMILVSVVFNNCFHFDVKKISYSKYFSTNPRHKAVENSFLLEFWSFECSDSKARHFSQMTCKTVILIQCLEGNLPY